MAVKAFEVYGEVVLKDSGAAKKLESFGKKAQQVGKNLTKFVTLPLLGIGAAMLKVANDQLQAEAALQNAIKATGRETEISVDRLKEYTAALQETTTYGDEAQLSALALVQQLGNLNEEGLKKILPSMLDFSAAMGVDLQTAASLIGKTLGSSTNALSRYGIEIDATASTTEKLAQLTAEMDEKFSGAAETAAKTGLGGLLQLKNSVGDLAEEFGTLLLPTLNKIIDGVKQGIKWFSDLDEGQKKLIITLAGVAAAAGPVIAAIGGITRAMALLTAHPLILAATAVAALGIAIFDATKEQRQLNAASKDLAKATAVSSKNVAALADEYTTLSEKAKLTADQEARQAELAEELHRLLPDLTTDQINDGKSLNAASRERAIYNKELAESAKAILEARKATLSATVGKQLKEYEENFRAMSGGFTDKEWQAAQGEFTDWLRQVAPALNINKAELFDLDVAIYKANKTIAESNGVIGAYSITLDEYSEKTDAATGATGGLSDEIETLADKFAAMQDIYRTESEETYAAFKQWGTEYVADQEEIATLVAQIKLEKQQEAFQQAQELRDKEKQELKELEDAYKSYAQTIGSAVTPLLEQLGTAIVENGDAWIDLGRLAVGAIAGIVRGLGEQAIIQSALSFAGGDLVGGFGYAGAATAAFIAAGVIDGLAGSFEQGGMIPGNSYTGDKLLARVNSGERVLTAQQNAQYEAMMQSPAISYQTNNVYNNRSEDTNVYVGEEKIFTIVQRGMDSQKIIPGRRTI